MASDRNSEHPPNELWLVRHGADVLPVTPMDALDRLASLAYDGALPGTAAERWVWSRNAGWLRDDQPYAEGDGS